MTMTLQTQTTGRCIPAYINTNEDLRWITNAVPGNHVLTVTASGDQALFYHLSGAKTIDTFDMTIFAGLIQDIKTSAIQTLSHQGYCDLMSDLSSATRNTESVLRNMDRIIPRLSPQNRHLLIKPLPFDRFFNTSYVANANPTASEYTKLQTTLSHPFKFIHSTLDTLHTKLSAQYDIINISNIFDKCYTPAEKIKIMQNLLPHLTVGGRLLYIPQYNTLDYSKINITPPNTNMQLTYEKTLTNPADKWSKIISLQRTR